MEEITDITDQLEMLEDVVGYDNTVPLTIERNLNVKNVDTSTDSGTYITRGSCNTSSENKDSLTDFSQSGGDNDDFSSGDDEPPPLMIVPEVSLGGDDFFSQEVEITEECVELVKDKMSAFDYKCSLCEFSTTQVSGNIYYIRSRSGNIYFPCEMCQFVKITLQTATATYMSSVTKKVNRDGSETLLSPGSHNKQRTDLINYTRKAATEFVAKYHLGMKNSNQANKTLSTSQFASYNNSASPSPAPPSPAVDLGGGGVLLSMGAGYDIPSSQVSSGAGHPSSWELAPESSQSPHVDVNTRSGVERKYSCDYCPYNTTTFYRLQQHEQKDHKIERYVCPQVKCTFEASDENTLKEHVLNVHEGSRFPCHLCSFLATRKATLKTHIESIHEGVKYPCEQCGYAATQMSALRRHIRSQHGVNSKDARNNRRPYMPLLLPK